MQGVAIAERAYQQALAFARERRQGRSASGGDGMAPIIEHPDVQRMLMTMKASCRPRAASATSPASRSTSPTMRRPRGARGRRPSARRC